MRPRPHRRAPAPGLQPSERAWPYAQALALVKRGLAARGEGDWAGADRDEDDGGIGAGALDGVFFGGKKKEKPMNIGEGDWAGADEDEEDEYAAHSV